MIRFQKYCGEQLLILDLKFLKMWPSQLSVNHRNTLERLARHYYTHLTGPQDTRIPLKECEDRRLFKAVNNLHDEAKRRLEKYKTEDGLEEILFTWRYLRARDRKNILEVAKRKKEEGDSDGLSERLYIQLEGLPEEIPLKGTQYDYPIKLLYQQL